MKSTYVILTASLGIALLVAFSLTKVQDTNEIEFPTPSAPPSEELQTK